MKIIDLVDKLITKEKEQEKPPTPYLKRGNKGRFVSKKKAAPAETLQAPAPVPVEVEVVSTSPHETITATFYGMPITKYRVHDKWYFSVKDVLAVGKPLIELSTVQFTPEFEEVKKNNTILVNDVEVAEAGNIIKIIREVKAMFPGPLSRWLSA